MLGYPRRHCLHDGRLPQLRLWLGVGRVIVDGEAVLGTVNLDELVFDGELAGSQA